MPCGILNQEEIEPFYKGVFWNYYYKWTYSQCIELCNKTAPFSLCVSWFPCYLATFLNSNINQITPTKSRVFSKERPCVPPFIPYCAWIKHMRPSHWIRLNIKPLKIPGIFPFPNSRTIPINVNKSYVKGWGKTIPIMFYYIFILWTGLLDDKSVLLQNHNSLGKTSMKFPFFVLFWCCQKEKSQRLNTSWMLLTCSDYYTVDDTPIKCQLYCS